MTFKDVNELLDFLYENQVDITSVEIVDTNVWIVLKDHEMAISYSTRYNSVVVQACLSTMTFKTDALGGNLFFDIALRAEARLAGKMAQ